MRPRASGLKRLRPDTTTPSARAFKMRTDAPMELSIKAWLEHAEIIRWAPEDQKIQEAEDYLAESESFSYRQKISP